MVFRNWRNWLESICIPIAAIALALILFGVFCTIEGYNPFLVYASIYKGAFASWFSWQNTLLRASPLMLSALCTVLPARLGLIIIGNEGALVMSGLVSAVTGLSLTELSPPLALFLMAIAGMVTGGVWIAAIGALRHYRGVNETISSLLLNYVAIALLSHLVEGPLRDPRSLNQPSTYPLPHSFLLGDFPGSRIHYGLLYGLLACAIAYVLIQRTTFGFATRVVGGNIRAAKMAGLAVGKLTLAICFLGGTCAGLAGMVEVTAVHGRANGALHSNYGYTGILVAFVARQNPLAVILVSILMGGILASGSLLQRVHGLPDATVLLFQGLVFLVILYSESWYGQMACFQEPAVADEESNQPCLDPPGKPKSISV